MTLEEWSHSLHSEIERVTACIPGCNCVTVYPWNDGFACMAWDYETPILEEQGEGPTPFAALAALETIALEDYPHNTQDSRQDGSGCAAGD